MTTDSHPPSPSRAGASVQDVSRAFVLVTLATSALVVALGWTTGLRDLMHASLLAACVFALFPFIILASLLAAIIVFFLALGIAHAAVGADDFVHDGVTAHVSDGVLWLSKGIAPYYRWLTRHRRSPLLGLPAGLLLGGLLLWAALATVVLPREARTMERLLLARAIVEHAYRTAKHFPPPDADGRFTVPAEVATLPPEARGSESQLLDAFGRTVRYTVIGRSRLASYQLLSLGSDGVRSADDLCVSGQTRLHAALEAVTTLGAAVSALRLEDMSWTDRLAHIQSARCDGS